MGLCMSVTIEMDVYKCFEQFSNFTIVLMSQLLIVYSFFFSGLYVSNSCMYAIFEFIPIQTNESMLYKFMQFICMYIPPPLLG